MQVILEQERKDAIEYMTDLIYSWNDPVPMTDMSGIGEELYRLLKDDFCMILPSLTIEQLNELNETIICGLENPEWNLEWTLDSLFTIMEDEGLIEIVKW